MMRVVLIGAAGAGKSRVLDAIALAGGAAATSLDARRMIETTTARRRYQIIDAPSVEVPSVLSMGDVSVAVVVVSAADGPLPATKAHVSLARECGVRHLAGVLCDEMVDDAELTDLVELELRELATVCGFDGDSMPIVRTRPRRETHSTGGIGPLAAALDRFD